MIKPVPWVSSLVSWDLAAFMAATVLYLVPIFAYRFVPTQDGPSHLANAVILKDHHREETRYREFFKIRWELYPNWTAEVLLVGFLHLVPPYAAEKLVVTIYVVGFVAAYRYFSRPFEPAGASFSHAALLFVYNRCFWMGFYNFCLAMALVWVVLGYCIRHRASFGVRNTFVMSALLTVTYFTHLIGFCLSILGAATILGWGGGRWRRLSLLSVATLPAATFLIENIARTRFLAPGGASGMLTTGLVEFYERGVLVGVVDKLNLVHNHLFGTHSARVPLGALTLAAGVIVLVASRLSGSRDCNGPPRSPVALLGLAIVVLYLILPASLGRSGGFLPPRLAIFPALLWLTCIRGPVQAGPRLLLSVGIYGLVLANLCLVVAFDRNANAELREYTSGIAAVGRGHTLTPIHQTMWRWPRMPDYTEHAADYYCLTTRNIDLYNYEARSLNFPVHARPSRNGMLDDDMLDEPPDFVLCWDAAIPHEYESYQRVYHRGRLQIVRRPSGDFATGGLQESKASPP